VWHYVATPVLLHWHCGVGALWRRVLHDLEVGYISFIINAYAGV
jgi:hypothetical protein